MEPVENANGEQVPSHLANALEWAQQQPQWPEVMAQKTEQFGEISSPEEIKIFVLIEVLQLNNVDINNVPHPNWYDYSKTVSRN